MVSDTAIASLLSKVRVTVLNKRLSLSHDYHVQNTMRDRNDIRDKHADL